MSGLNYDNNGFIVGVKKVEKGLNSVKDDTQTIIDILKGEQQQADSRSRQSNRIIEQAVANSARQTVGAINRTQARRNNITSNASNAVNQSTSNARRNSNNSNSNSSNSNNSNRQRGADGRFISDGSNNASNKFKRELLKDIATTFRGVGTDSKGIDPLLDSVNEMKEVTAPLGKGFGLLKRGIKGGAKWSWSKFKSLKRKEPLPNQQERHNRMNERYLKDIRNASGGGGGLFSKLLAGLGGLKNLLPSGLGRGGRRGGYGYGGGDGRNNRNRNGRGGRNGGAGRGGNRRGGRLGRLGRLGRGAGRLLRGGGRLLGGVGALLGAGLLASEWGNLDHKGKSRGVGGLVGGTGGAMAGGAIGATVGSVVPVIGTAIGGLVGAGIGGWLGSSAGEKLGETASPYIQRWTASLISSNLPQKMSSVFSFGTNTLFASLGLLTGVFSDSWFSGTTPFFDSLKSIGDSVSSTLSDVATTLSNIAQKVANKAGEIFDDVSEGAGNAWNGAVDYVTNGFNNVKNWAMGVPLAKGAKEGGYNLTSQNDAKKALQATGKVKGGGFGQATKGGKGHLGTYAMALNSLDILGNTAKQITAVNDAYHHSAGYKRKVKGRYTSRHIKGMAFDITTKDDRNGKATASAQKIRDYMTSMGMISGKDYKLLDEYKRASAGASGGHLHFAWKSQKSAQKYYEMQRKQGKKGAVNGLLGSFSGKNGSSKQLTRVLEAGKGYNVVQLADGSIEKRSGNWNWRNNNPGNISDGAFARSMGALSQKGAKGKHKRFAIFPTYEAGRKAKEKLIFGTKNYRNKTLKQAIARYAPSFENNTGWYQSSVLKAVGGRNKKMYQYTARERQAIMNAMEKVEGYKRGKVTVLKKGQAMPKITASVPKSIARPMPKAKPRPIPKLNFDNALSKRLDNGGRDKPIIVQASNQDISQNVSDRDLAHAISGGLGGNFW